MIAIDIQCSQGHVFEGWFENLEAFEDQKHRGLVTCPYCEDHDVRRVLSPVTVRSSRAAGDHETPADEVDLARLARKVIDYVLQHSEDVGPRFATEALKMHYGVAEKRSIRGSATEEEESMLRGEGIRFVKLPLPVSASNKKN